MKTFVPSATPLIVNTAEAVEYLIIVPSVRLPNFKLAWPLALIVRWALTGTASNFRRAIPLLLEIAALGTLNLPLL
jgi:hypothetical protein